MAFFKRYVKYGMSDGTATEPVWTSQTRTEYARRIHVVCTTLGGKRKKRGKGNGSEKGKSPYGEKLTYPFPQIDFITKFGSFFVVVLIRPAPF